MKKVYCVELKEPQDGEKRLNFFGSQAAIFQHMDSGRLGIKYSSLRANYNVAQQDYENAQCRITFGWLLQAKRNIIDTDNND